MTTNQSVLTVGPAETFNHNDTHQYFDLEGHKEISQIFLSAGVSGITSIRFQYVENGNYVLTDLYGSCDNLNQFRTIELNHPAEYITGVKGLYSSSLDSENIQVITFTTNVREYGPFGLTSPNLQSQFVSSRNFTYDLGKSRQFGGFHGSYNPTSLISIGFYLDVKTKLSNSASEIPKMIKVGPEDRVYFEDDPHYFDLKGHKEISQIFLTAGLKGITSIQFQYVENGKYVLSDLYGSCGKINQFHTIELNHPAEYITGIKGMYVSSSYSIQLITFTTNIQEYAPFGLNSREVQSQPSPYNFTYNLGMSRQFGGFHGSCNSTGLLSLGFYLSAKTVAPNSGSKIF